MFLFVKKYVWNMNKKDAIKIINDSERAVGDPFGNWLSVWMDFGFVGVAVEIWVWLLWGKSVNFQDFVGDEFFYWLPKGT
jgi:hypothetical protein